MKKKLIWGGSVLAGIILLVVGANFYVKNKLQQELDNRLQSSSYKDLSVNILLNKFSIADVEVKQERFSLIAERIQINGLSYSKYLFQNEIEIDELELSSPKVRLFPKDSTEETDKSNKGREVLIKKISVEDGILSKQKDNEQTSFYGHSPVTIVRNFRTGMEISELNAYSVQLDTLYLKMNSEHYIDIGELSAESGQVEISDFQIRSFYPPGEFEQKIPYEKDRITLDVQKISLDSLNFSKRNDSLFLTNPTLNINEATLNIYRNKLVEDDPGTIALYSKKLREAPVLLNFEKVLVKNSEIVYEERVKAEGSPASVRFAGINGEINNLHNLQELDKEVKISANGDFMRGTPVSIDWSFPVFDPQESFTISGRFGRLEGTALDPFLVPAMNAQARGTVDEVFFNFYGNDDVLQGDFRMDYEKFKIELLSEENKKKGFMSSIANLFVDNEQEADESGAQEVMVERTKNRSFWNFAWKGLREGLIDAVGQL